MAGLIHRLLPTVLLACMAVLGWAHPGNGLAVLPDGSVITGDAVNSAVWRFRAGAAPERILSDFHCHWVTLGRDGHVYAETQSQSAGAWQTTIYRLDLKAKKANPILKGSQSLGVFLVDKDSSIIALVEGTLQRYVNGQPSPFRGYGKQPSGQPGPDGDRAMAWAPNGDVYLLCGTKLWSAGSDGVLKERHAFRGTAYGLYAGPGEKVQPWGFALDGASRVIVADPSSEQVYRLGKDAKPEVLDWTFHDWAALGIQVSQGRIYLLESKTMGNRNQGPRVSVLDKDGKKRSLGTVGNAT